MHTSSYWGLIAKKSPHLQKNSNANDGSVMMPSPFSFSLSHLPLSLPPCLPGCPRHPPALTWTGHKAEKNRTTGEMGWLRGWKLWVVQDSPVHLPCYFPQRGLPWRLSHKELPQSPIITLSHSPGWLFFPSTLHCLKWLFIFCFLVMYDFYFSSLIECKHHESRGFACPVHSKISSAQNSAWSQEALS